MLMSAKFDGKIVLVAGGTGGLGRAVTLAFLEGGAKVIVTYRAQKECEALKIAPGKKQSNLEGELRGSGVRVNSIMPSIIDTEANRKAMPTADFSKWPKPEDIARVILFLCSDDAKVIHGAAIPVYGDS